MDKINRIDWSELGISSLEHIISFIAKDSPFYASSFTIKLLDIIDNLIAFPNYGRIVPEIKDEKIREIIFHNYRIVYQYGNHIITIVYVGHCSKSLPSLN